MDIHPKVAALGHGGNGERGGKGFFTFKSLCPLPSLPSMRVALPNFDPSFSPHFNPQPYGLYIRKPGPKACGKCVEVGAEADRFSLLYGNLPSAFHAKTVKRRGEGAGDASEGREGRGAEGSRRKSGIEKLLFLQGGRPIQSVEGKNGKIAPLRGGRENDSFSLFPLLRFAFPHFCPFSCSDFAII